MTENHRASGRLVGFVAAIPLALGFIGIGIVAIVRSQARGATSDAAQIAVGLVGGFAVGVSLLTLVALFSAFQAVSVRRAFPDEVVVSAVRGPQFDRAIRELSLATGSNIPGPPHWFSMVLRETELQFWGGLLRPRLSFRLPSKDIVGIEAVDFGTNARGIVLTVELRGDRLRMPIVSLGAGPFWVFSKRLEELDRVAGTWRNKLPMARR